MQQYVVPQFIEVEAKIIGPISARQFIEILVTLGMCYVWYTILPSIYLVVPAVFISGAVGIILAFAKVNGQMMHYFLLNVIQTLRRPVLKVWFRSAYEELVHLEEVAAVKEIVEKGEVTSSRLAEISLMVDTGGAYAAQEFRDQSVRPKDAVVSAIPNTPSNTIGEQSANQSINYGQKKR